ncbi:hypothetical protein, partial [Enorma sp.]|uniref:hypothetical protein n=1 Tax=Enorma sp. TaxID=1920692 RepID=UPI003AB24CB9
TPPSQGGDHQFESGTGYQNFFPDSFGVWDFSLVKEAQDLNRAATALTRWFRGDPPLSTQIAYARNPRFQVVPGIDPGYKA